MAGFIPATHSQHRLPVGCRDKPGNGELFNETFRGSIVRHHVIRTVTAADMADRIIRTPAMTDMTHRIVGTAATADMTHRVVSTPALTDMADRIIGPAAVADMAHGVVSAAAAAGLGGNGQGRQRGGGSKQNGKCGGRLHLSLHKVQALLAMTAKLPDRP